MVGLDRFEQSVIAEEVAFVIEGFGQAIGVEQNMVFRISGDRPLFHVSIFRRAEGNT